jgi:UDP-glucose 4-epimerase
VPLTWVVGASGLLGRSTSALAQHRHHDVLRTPVPWEGDRDTVVSALLDGAEQLLRRADGQRWNLVWVAGAGVVGSSPEALAAELAVYQTFLSELAGLVSRQQTRNASVFLASSAGGVYAGAADPPFSELTPVSPLAAYGATKLAMEEATHAFVQQTGLPAMIGRISNLYGPGQNISKPQGLISQLAKAYLLRTPILLYVSLDTIRDYLYVGDCARMVVRAVELMRADERSAAPTVKILASGRPTTIAELLGVFQRLFKRRAPLVLGDSPNRKLQVRDLRMRSQVWTELDRFMSTPLPAGIGQTINDLSARQRSGELSRVG